MRHSNTRLEHGSRLEGRSVQAFAPGRVNLIGEHTDYNDGLCLPFAVEPAITVAADAGAGSAIEARAARPRRERPLRNWRRGHARRGLAAPRPGRGARSCEAKASRCAPAGSTIRADLPAGAGLSSSAAVFVALCLALCEVAGAEPPGRGSSSPGSACASRTTGRAPRPGCSTSSPACSASGAARVRHRHARPELRPVALDLGGHALVTLDSGASRSLADSGYNGGASNAARLPRARASTRCATPPARAACPSRSTGACATCSRRTSEWTPRSRRSSRRPGRARPPARRLAPQPARRLRGVGAGDRAGGRGLPRAGALGARIMGGGFGGSVLALFGPDREPPARRDSGPPGAGRAPRSDLIEPPPRGSPAGLQEHPHRLDRRGDLADRCSASPGSSASSTDGRRGVHAGDRPRRRRARPSTCPARPTCRWSRRWGSRSR